MSALNPPRRISKRHELREDTVVTLYARAWGYFDRNRTVVYAALAGVVVLVLALVGYLYYRSGRQAEAQELLAPAVLLYEQQQYRQALDGSPGQMGLIALADEYGGTEAGNLARFYAADALYRLGEHEQALQYFNAYDRDDDILGASALAGEAAIYEAQGNFARADERYRQAASAYPNEISSPQYLLNAGRAYEQAGNYREALVAYRMIEETYPESPQAANIDLYIARAEAQTGTAS